MKKHLLDYRFIIGVIIAHLLLFFSFQERTIFWYIFTGSILVLISYSMFQDDVEDNISFIAYLFWGAVSGALLYVIFWLGFHALDSLIPSFDKSVAKLYKRYAPSLFWQYIALIIVAAPGEELFWRGFIQKRLLAALPPFISIGIGALLYASVHLYSGSFFLVLAALISGLVWGWLYYWKKSMPLVIVSHIVFDLLIFIILPFK